MEAKGGIALFMPGLKPRPVNRPDESRREEAVSVQNEPPRTHAGRGVEDKPRRSSARNRKWAYGNSAHPFLLSAEARCASRREYMRTPTSRARRRCRGRSL